MREENGAWDKLLAERKAEFVPATMRQKVVLATVLVVASIGIAIGWFKLFEYTAEALHKEVRLKWNKPADLELTLGPTAFWYDGDKQELVYRGQISAEDKAKLFELPNASDRTIKVSPVELADYRKAVDALAFKSQSGNDTVYILILTLAGLSGTLGVMSRSNVNFIRIACFQNVLDFNRWWPWYLMRPVLGFLLGLLAVLLVQARIYVPNSGSVDSLDWWMGFAMLVGFGAEDFADRVRLVSQTLFGKGDSSSGSK